MSTIDQLTEIESRLVLLGIGKGKGDGRKEQIGVGFFLGQWKYSKIDFDDDYKILWITKKHWLLEFKSMKIMVSQ